MLFRPKLFLTFSVLCVTPLLFLNWLSFRGQLRTAEALLRNNLNGELADTAWGFQTLVRERERELQALARGPLRSYVLAVNAEAQVSMLRGQETAKSAGSAGVVHEAELAIETLWSDQGYYARVACFAPDKQPMLVAEPSTEEPSGIRFRTRDFLPGQIQPDEAVWSSAMEEVICSVVSHPSFGDVLRCTAPVRMLAETAQRRGALVADLRLDYLLAESVRAREAPPAADKTPNSRLTVVLDSSGTIVYHPNDAHKHQPVGSAMPYFVPAASMIRGETGSAFYDSPEGERWIEGHVPLKPFGLSLAVARNDSQGSQALRRARSLGVVLSILFGLAGASLLTAYFQKQAQRIERITEKVEAIAQGDLDQRVEPPSRDDLRPIADSVNVMSERLREQIAREAEAHQFQSFIKLSALLTHDLKNAIEALSLTVSNMERHHDNPEFRADALKGLTSATEKLRALVGRLSNPVNTLSGEFKRPRPTDLVPLLSRVLVRTADPLSARHEIDLRLPPSLYGLADAERIEKVIENLVLNAIEAMSGKKGKLTIAAGATADSKVFFSVSDTGVGMSPEFIQQRLFRPFVTTKKRGVGLGSYTCREVVRANGGTIEVHSTEGSGTTIRVVLASANELRMKAEG